jgi:hypothetical protein
VSIASAAGVPHENMIPEELLPSLLPRLQVRPAVMPVPANCHDVLLLLSLTGMLVCVCVCVCVCGLVRGMRACMFTGDARQGQGQGRWRGRHHQEGQEVTPLALARTRVGAMTTVGACPHCGAWRLSTTEGSAPSKRLIGSTQSLGLTCRARLIDPTQCLGSTCALPAASSTVKRLISSPANNKQHTT